MKYRAAQGRPVRSARRGWAARQRVRQETVGEVHHGTALITPVGVLLEYLLAQLTRVIGHETGVSGDETDNTEVGAAPFAPRTRQVDGLLSATDLVFLQRYPTLHLIDVVPRLRQRQSLWFAPRAFVHSVDGRPELRELRCRTTHHPGTPDAALDAIGDFRSRNTFRQPFVQLHPFRVIRIRLEF
ncbi:hypothetical protein [Nocardia gipuzkoensis]